ncbi:MAG: carbonic anhydrase [Proteobacteria bacterium]|nr:carbonic anhydrase [Pseudomonadota bacterium]
MKKIISLFVILLTWTPCYLLALEKNKEQTTHQEVRNFLNHIFDDNAIHVSILSHRDMISYSEQQSPRATIVACSDSRVQANAFHRSPINDLFFIRNIGNQVQTTLGSVEYGIYHLKTPVLLIIGHSQCGAVKASLGDYSKELPAIVNELDHIHLPKDIDVDSGVIENVNYQVNYALEQFKDKIDKKELVVIGAVYDFRDDFGHGHGRLILINLNGEQDPIKIKNNPYIIDLDHIAIGRKK